MGKNNKAGPDRRRFQRVSFSEGEIAGAEVIWPTKERLPVFDMSLTGAALGRPRDMKLLVTDQMPLRLRLGRFGEVEVRAEIMWFNDNIVGIHFSPQPTEVRLKLNAFLTDRLVGANLRPVDKAFFAAGLDCDRWLHGPRETNVYLWQGEGSRLTHVMIEFDGWRVEWKSATQQWTFAQVENENLSMPDWYGGSMGSRSLLVQRMIDLLGQVQKNDPLVKEVIEHLKGAKT